MHPARKGNLRTRRARAAPALTGPAEAHGPLRTEVAAPRRHGERPGGHGDSAASEDERPPYF
ncbi:hypothetical protein EAO69_32025 [Streptomyces sp. me109]|nr:hypothetical protein EAO69_32025 [Streptomyces sp. me109]